MHHETPKTELTPDHLDAAIAVVRSLVRPAVYTGSDGRPTEVVMRELEFQAGRASVLGELITIQNRLQEDREKADGPVQSA